MCLCQCVSAQVGVSCVWVAAAVKTPAPVNCPSSLQPPNTHFHSGHSAAAAAGAHKPSGVALQSWLSTFSLFICAALTERARSLSPCCFVFTRLHTFTPLSCHSPSQPHTDLCCTTLRRSAHERPDLLHICSAEPLGMETWKMWSPQFSGSV